MSHTKLTASKKTPDGVGGDSLENQTLWLSKGIPHTGLLITGQPYGRYSGMSHPKLTASKNTPDNVKEGGFRLLAMSQL
jgi:hypothetical protein